MSTAAALGDELVLYRLRPDGSEFGPIELPRDANCTRLDYSIPTPLPDGRLGFAKKCARVDPEEPLRLQLLAYDFKSGEVELLVKDSVPFGLNGSFSWNPSLTRGMYGGGFNSPCTSIVWLTRQGIEPATITVGEGAGAWRLDDAFRLGSRCAGVGRATWPSWSPDGKTIAFLASPSAHSSEGLDRLDSSMSLYFVDPTQLHPERVLDGIQEGWSFEWSPDSRWLAFGGQVNDRWGLWMFEAETRRLAMASNIRALAVTWSPDGKRVLARRNLGAEQSISLDDLVIVDVTDLVS